MANGFYSGRNGTDALSAFLTAAALVIAVAASVSEDAVRAVLSIAALAAAGIAFFRMMSRNVARRRYENEVFLSLFRRKGKEKHEEPGYRYYRCPECRTECRVPKGKGKIRITCPKCGHQFVKKT